MIASLSLSVEESDFFFHSSQNRHFSLSFTSKPNFPLSISLTLLNPAFATQKLIPGTIAHIKLSYQSTFLHLSLRIRSVSHFLYPPNQVVFLELGNEQMLLPVAHKSFQNIYASSLFSFLTKKYATFINPKLDPLIPAFSIINPLWSLQFLALKTQSLVCFLHQSISVVPRPTIYSIPSVELPFDHILHIQPFPKSLSVTTFPQLQWNIFQTVLPGIWIDQIIHNISSHPFLGRSFSQLQLRYSP